MANKANYALAVDREAIAALQQFAVAYANEVEEARTGVAANVKYLTDSENIDGGDADTFKETVFAVNEHLTEVQAKADSLVAVVGCLMNILGENAAVKHVSMQKAKEDLAAAVIKVKQSVK